MNNAILKFVKGNQYHADKLVLKIGNLLEFAFATNAKFLNVLEKFVPIKLFKHRKNKATLRTPSQRCL